MMRTRALWMLGLAFLMAGAAVFLARNWLDAQVSQSRQVAAPKPAFETTPVVVAATQLQFGNPIKKEHLKVVAWPKQSLPEGTFAAVGDIVTEGKERAALRTMEVNEPVLMSKVSGFGANARASLSMVIAQDMRAATIRVNDVNGVAGFVLPGDRVDILLTRPLPQNADEIIADLLLQNVKVLGIDQDTNENRDKPAVVRTVTVEATVEQSQKLLLAQQVGTLSLTLRNIANNDAQAARTVGLRDLGIGEINLETAPAQPVVAAGEPPPTPVARTDAAFSIRIVRGLSPTEYEVEQEKLDGLNTALARPARSLSAPTPPNGAALDHHGQPAFGPPTPLLRGSPFRAPVTARRP